MYKLRLTEKEYELATFLAEQEGFSTIGERVLNKLESLPDELVLIPSDYKAENRYRMIPLTEAQVQDIWNGLPISISPGQRDMIKYFRDSKFGTRITNIRVPDAKKQELRLRIRNEMSSMRLETLYRWAALSP